jgi:hypothetical protein
MKYVIHNNNHIVVISCTFILYEFYNYKAKTIYNNIINLYMHVMLFMCVYNILKVINIL